MAQNPPSESAEAPTFGQRLRALREAGGWSQEELAQRAGVSTDAVSSLERGTRSHPYPATVRALAEALELPARERAVLAAAVPRRSRPASGARQVMTSGPGALPAAATPLLGRDEDVAAVFGLLADPSVRLVTLTGTGGIGKSRLAMAVAERIAPMMTDGAAFVPLADVLDDSLMLPQIVRALAFDGAARRRDDLLVSLAPLEVLLVLDNVEHLPGSAGVVADLLLGCPRMTLLVTSRAPLRIRGETEYTVLPLRLPALGATEVSAVLDSPAASLLMDRGRAVRRDLVLRSDDAPAVAGICHRVAGLPLALEIAAAGLRVMDPAALLAHLDEVLAQGGPVDLPVRQRTMRATLDWSYGLLDQSDQKAFRRASAFVGGFTLEAAHAVLGVDDILGAVERLTARSLFSTASSPDAVLRYGMLEPVAQYAASLLAGQEEVAARWAHAQFFVHQAEELERALMGGEQVQALDRFDTEESNLWSALEWAVAAGEADLAGRFSWALFMFWWVRGQRGRGGRLIERVLDLDLSDMHRARALHAAAALAEPGTVAAERVERLYLASAADAERCGDRGVEAASALGAGLVALGTGDLATAVHRLHRGLAAAQQAGQWGEWPAALAHCWLAAAKRFQGDPERSVVYSLQALESTRRRSDVLSESIALYNLGQAELALGHDNEARQHLIEGVRVCLQTRDAGNLSYLLDALAAVEHRAGGRERVVTLLGAAEALREDVGSSVYSWYAPDLVMRDRIVAEARERLDERAYARAFDAGRSLSLDGAVELAARSPQPPT